MQIIVHIHLLHSGGRVKRTEIGAGADHEVSAAKLAMTGAGCHDELYERKNLVQEVEGREIVGGFLCCCVA